MLYEVLAKSKAYIIEVYFYNFIFWKKEKKIIKKVSWWANPSVVELLIDWINQKSSEVKIQHIW